MVKKDNIGLNSEAAAGAAPADVRSVQEASDAGRQRSTRGGGAYTEEEDEVVGAAPYLGARRPTALADAVAVEAPEHVDHVV